MMWDIISPGMVWILFLIHDTGKLQISIQNDNVETRLENVKYH